MLNNQMTMDRLAQLEWHESVCRKNLAEALVNGTKEEIEGWSEEIKKYDKKIEKAMQQLGLL